jgi:hypothetical protein
MSSVGAFTILPEGIIARDELRSSSMDKDEVRLTEPSPQSTPHNGDLPRQSPNIKGLIFNPKKS